MVAIDAHLHADGWFEVTDMAGAPLPVSMRLNGRGRREKGAGEILLTSMRGDGTKAGFDIPLTRAVSDAVSVPVIASGGAGTPEHFAEAITEGHASAVLVPLFSLWTIYHR